MPVHGYITVRLNQDMNEMHADLSTALNLISNDLSTAFGLPALIHYQPVLSLPTSTLCA